MPNASGYKKGKWKTYVYVEGQRKEVVRKTENEVLDWLYDFYTDQDAKTKTLQFTFDQYMTYKKDTLLRSQQTVNENIRIFKLLDVTLREKPVFEITDEDIKRFLVEKYLPTRPPESEFIKMMQVLDQTMAFGLSKKYCADNPMKYLNSSDYLKHCNRSVKSNEEKAFSAKELSLITADAMQDKSNPRALMLLLAKETGLRAGELPVLRKTDIRDGFIHVHCQQIRESDPDGHLRFFELQYTKSNQASQFFVTAWFCKR